MMDVLPPKWTELFQHQQDQEIVEHEKDHSQSAHSHRSCRCHIPTHYNTYHDLHNLAPSPRKFRTHSYSSNPSTIEPQQENETQLRGTRFRLTKATIPLDDQINEHQQIDDQYV